MIAAGCVILLFAFAAVSQAERGLWALAIGVLSIDLG